MRAIVYLVFGVAGLLASVEGVAAPARLIKVLPHYLDLAGKHTLAPSLYERDAYQAYLRTHPEERSALRFDIQWKSRAAGKYVVRLELRGRQGKESTTALLETNERKRGLFSNWTSLLLTGDAYQQFGELTAWRATLWDGDTLVSHQQSFLW